MALINSGVTPKATEIAAGAPVPAHAVTQQGSTFAARAAAAQKAVHVEDVEDKSVSSASTKARKTAAKKA